MEKVIVIKKKESGVVRIPVNFLNEGETRLSMTVGKTIITLRKLEPKEEK